jgi:hypothetical protein
MPTANRRGWMRDYMKEYRQGKLRGNVAGSSAHPSRCEELKTAHRLHSFKWRLSKPLSPQYEILFEQVFYVTSLYLKISKRIDPKIRIEEQFRVASSGKGLHVDFRLSLADEVHPDLPPLVAFVECDSRAFHDRTPEELTQDRQRW